MSYYRIYVCCCTKEVSLEITLGGVMHPGISISGHFTTFQIRRSGFLLSRSLALRFLAFSLPAFISRRVDVYSLCWFTSCRYSGGRTGYIIEPVFLSLQSFKHDSECRDVPFILMLTPLFHTDVTSSFVSHEPRSNRPSLYCILTFLSTSS